MTCAWTVLDRFSASAALRSADLARPRASRAVLNAFTALSDATAGTPAAADDAASRPKKIAVMRTQDFQSRTSLAKRTPLDP